jgi:lipopolysaccharide exporter
LFTKNIYKDVLKLSSSSFLSQFLLFLFSPFILNFYVPEEFGYYTKLSSTVILLTIISTGQFEIGIVKELKLGSIRLTQLSSLLLIVFLSIMIVFQLTLFCFEFISYFDAVVIFLGVLFLGLYNIGYNLSLKYHDYNRIALSRLIQVICTLIMQIIFAYYFDSSNGLIIGWLLGIFFSLFFFRLFGIYRICIMYTNQNKLIKLMKINSQLPLYQMTTGLINNLSVLIPIYLIEYYYSTKEVGLYSFALKIVILPVTVLSANISQIFYNNLSANINLKKESTLLVKQYMEISVYSGLFFVLALYFIPVSLFNFLFSSKWLGSYQLIIKFIPFVFILYVSTIFQPSYIVFNRLKLLFNYNVLLLILRIISIIIGFILFRDFNISILLFILSGSIIWYLIFYNSIKLLKFETVTRRLIYVTLICLILMLLISNINLF